MNPNYRIFLVLVILAVFQSVSPQSTGVTATQVEHNTIVQGNHFYSNYQLAASYNIAQVNISRPLMFVLRKKDDNQIFENPINITLISGQKSVQCKFTSFNSLCYIDNLPSQNMTMKIRCDHLPCELSWTIIQHAPNKLLAKQNDIQDLYNISASSEHLIISISCNNPQVKDFSTLISVYSQNQFVKGNTNDIIYLLFKKVSDAHLYLDMKPQAKACSIMSTHYSTSQIKQDDYNKDFLYANQTAIYKFASRPQNQFRFDCSYHQMSNQAIKSQILLRITGEKSGVRQTINSVTVKPSIPTSGYQFNWAIPKIPAQFTNLQLQAKSSNAILIFNFYLSLSEQIQVQEGQYSYFNLTKGTKLKYKLVPSTASDASGQVMLIPAKSKQVRLNKRSCSRKDGCQFQVETVQNIQSLIYIGKSLSSQKKGQAIFVQFKGSISKKIRDQQIIYLSTPVKKDKSIQVVVNNPNVIIRAASSGVCDVPDAKCYQHVANSHHPFIYQPKKDGDLLITVQGLDVCQFTISVIEQGTDKIQLKDGQPFMYLMDDHENILQFKFSLPEKTGVSFNLIAPINDLILVVNNGKGRPDADQHISSTDGYISFTKDQLDEKQFAILVQKTPQAKNKFVHFTLIATTSGTNLRLDPGVAHVQTLKPKQFKQFVFEFDKKGDYIVNFYTPDIDIKQLKVKLLVNNQDKWNGDNVIEFDISRNSDVLNLKDVSQNLCIRQGDIQCEIFIRVQNNMKVPMDMTLTLLVKDSVIQLKDGLWQTYAINTIAKTSHFYFVPKTKNSSIDIMYKSTLVDIGISYVLWKSDKQNIDPSGWPFPLYKQEVDQKFSNLMSINHIMIDHENIQRCWPQCVILLSLYRKKSSLSQYDAIIKDLDPNYLGNFSIMVANKVLSIPQKSKIQIMLKQNQEKYMMVDLKHALKKQALTFFVNEILGSFSLYANVYSQKNPRCPTTDDHDFSFGAIQTQINMNSINNKRQQNDMDDDVDTFLCILATAYLQSKFTIQFTSDQSIIKLLHYDSFERFSIEPRQVKYYQLQANQKYELKFTRQKGYFYIKIQKCQNKEGKGYNDCLQQFQQSNDKGKQIITKTEQFAEQPCSKCIVFIKIEAEDPSQGIIHVQSQYSMIDLKQKDTVSDFTNQNQVNKYSITSVKDEETVINIAVTQGEPIVTVSNYYDLNITKQKDPKTGNILIVIPPQKTKQNTAGTSLGGVNYEPFAYSNTFRYLIVQIKSKDPKLSTAYTISYSSGERQTYLEDGLVISHTLQAKKKSIYLYKNPKLVQHGYLTISMGKSSTLYNLDFKMYSFANPQDQDSRVDVTPQKPPMRKHTPNPTIVYSLPASSLVSIQMQSQTQEKVTLVILHQQLVILPFDQQFPYELHNGQSINLITDVNNPGYLLISIRKCDQSSPDFGYTFSYDDFQKGQFQYTTNLANQAKFQFYVKASKIGTLYMQMNSTDDTGLFSISTHYSDAKIKGQKIKVGKNGILQYKIEDSKIAKVSFSGVVCSGSKCSKQVKYYWMAGDNLQDVYTQTVCPYSFFQVLGIRSSQPINITQINQHPDNNGVITFDYPYKDHLTYLSVKAVSGDEQVYYQPIQVITLWGTVKRSSRIHKLKIGAASLILCLCLCICMRRRKNKKQNPDYQKLPELGRDGFDY